MSVSPNSDMALPLSRTPRGHRGLRFMYLCLVGGLLSLAVGPLLFMFYSSFSSQDNIASLDGAVFTLVHYRDVVLSYSTYLLILNSAAFAVGSTIIGMFIAVSFAWLIERTDVPARPLFYVGMLVPMAIPNMIYTMSWIQLLAPNNGFVTVVLQGIGIELPFSVFSLTGMIFIQGIALSSHIFLLVNTPFRSLDPTWEEQSRIAGKRVWATLRRVTIPVLKPALLAALIFHFVVAIETFDVPVTLGLTANVSVLSTRIYWATHPEGGNLPNYGYASALGMILLLAAFIVTQLYQRQTRQVKSFATIGGRGFRIKRISLGPWRVPLLLLGLLYMIIAVGLPLFILLWRSLLRFYIFPSAHALSLLSFGAYRSVWDDAQFPEILGNTFAIAIVTGLVCVVTGALVAWHVVRAPSSAPAKRLLTTVALLPQSLPTIVIGLALIFVFLWLPIPIYGTIWIIAVGMVIKFVAYSSGTLIASQIQIASDLEDASRIAGARWARTYWRINAPLMAPALLSCMLWIMIHVVRELGLSLMLYNVHSQVLSTKVWLLWEGGRVADAAAVGVLTVIGLGLMLASISVIRYLYALYRCAKASVAVRALQGQLNSQ